jgi:hypothetical protein
MSRIVTTDYAIDKIASPNLPVAPDQWDRRFQDQFSNVLRLYFNRIDDFIARLQTSSGGAGIRLPYGAFSSYTTQTTTANTATLLSLSTTDFSNTVTLETGSKMVAANAGIYNLQFSAQIDNSANAPHDLYIWLRQNGVDIVGSTGIVGLPARKNPGDPFHTITGWNYYMSMNAGDHIQIYWSVTNAAITIPTYAASGTPTKPSTASVVATLSFVSALPA